MQAAFGIDFDPAWVMELESDAPHKFSRHLIIQIPGRAFANNLHVGAFVNDVCTTAVDSQSGISSLQVAKVLTPPLPPLCIEQDSLLFEAKYDHAARVAFLALFCCTPKHCGFKPQW